jgi:hypothetical protein
MTPEDEVTKSIETGSKNHDEAGRLVARANELLNTLCKAVSVVPHITVDEAKRFCLRPALHEPSGFHSKQPITRIDVAAQYTSATSLRMQNSTKGKCRCGRTGSELAKIPI